MGLWYGLFTFNVIFLSPVCPAPTLQHATTLHMRSMAQSPPHTPPHRPPCVDVYLGHWWAAEKAAHAYDIASIKLRGVNGANRALLLNFPLATYTEQIDQIMPMSFAEFLESVRATADALHPRLKAPGAKTDGGGDKKKGPAKKKK